MYGTVYVMGLICINLGRKQDVWYAINPASGNKRRVITTESTSDKCPGGSAEDMFIGRTGK